MSEYESYRAKERQYACYGLFTSSIQSQIKDCLEDLINSAIDDSRKKLSAPKKSRINLSESDINTALESMRKSYLSSLNEHSHKLDSSIDKAFDDHLMTMEVANENSNVDEEALDKEIEIMKLKLFALNAYRSQLIEVQNKLSGENPLDLTDQKHQLESLVASSHQRLNEIQLISDLFASKPENMPTNDLEASIMNMSID